MEYVDVFNEADVGDSFNQFHSVCTDQSCCEDNTNCCHSNISYSNQYSDHSHFHDHSISMDIEHNYCEKNDYCSACNSHSNHYIDHSHSDDHYFTNNDKNDVPKLKIKTSSGNQNDISKTSNGNCYKIDIGEEEKDVIPLIQKCSSCDSSSTIPHTLQLTRFKIANLS